MSADEVSRSGRGWRIAGWSLATASALVIILGFTIWWLFPWGPIDGLRVEEARIVRGNGAARADMNGNGEGLEVTFSVPTDLETFRARKDAGFINALVSSCGDGEFAVRENLVQRAEYFRPGRIIRLRGAAATDARVRYRVTLDSVLAVRRGADHAFVSLRDLPPNDICFSLEGGSMWAGKLWSDRVPVTFRGRPE